MRFRKSQVEATVARTTQITLDVPAEVMEDFTASMPGKAPEEIALAAFKKAVGEAMLRTFSRNKQQEVNDEAKRINERYGL